MFLFVADEVLSDGTQVHVEDMGGGGGGYFKLINKTNSGCSGRYIMPRSGLKLVRILQ